MKKLRFQAQSCVFRSIIIFKNKKGGIILSKIFGEVV